MRILIAAPFGRGYLASSYARAFERLGHEVFRFDSDRAYFQATWYAGNRLARRLMRRVLWDRLNRATVEVARCVRPQMLLFFKASFMHAETVRQLRGQLGVPVVNYYPDDPYCGVPLDPRKTSAQRRDLPQVLREYTRTYVWHEGLAERLSQDGASAAYLPFGVDSAAFHPCNGRPDHMDGAPGHQVVFVGQHRARRERHVDAVRRHSVGLWGARWRRAARRFSGRHEIHDQAVFGEDCAAVYHRADVCLNVLSSENIPGHNMRTFEIPASGAVMLATHTAEQARFFPEGEAACYYRDAAELDDLLDRLLGDPDLRERVRRAALVIARDHDYVHRAQTMLEDIGL